MNDILISNEPLENSFQETVQHGINSAWLAISFCIGTWTLLFASAPGLLRYAFLAMSFLCSLYLYWRHELQYVSFTWWLYFLTPFVRRVVDYRIGFDASGFMLAAPILASAIACFELRTLRRSDVRSLPFVLLTFGITYGLAVSLIRGTSIAITAQYFLSWLGPVAFGYLLYMRWERFSAFLNTLQTTFQWGLLVMGVYGAVQYLYAPDWDRFWMENALEKYTSFGTPQPLGIRSFSTMNAPQLFGLAIVVGLLITFYGRPSLLQKAAWIAGYTGLLLSMARSAWLEWAVAVAALAFLGRSRKILRTVLVAVFLFVVLGAVGAQLPIGRVVVDRIRTLDDLRDDGSAQERSQGYGRVLKASLASPFGEGWRIESENNNATSLPMPIHDGTPPEVLLSIGWFGFLTFYGALISGTWMVLRYVRLSVDQFIPVASALLIAYLVETMFNSMLVGSNELGLMTILGLGLGATRSLDWQISISESMGASFE